MYEIPDDDLELDDDDIPEYYPPNKEEYERYQRSRRLLEQIILSQRYNNTLLEIIELPEKKVWYE